MSAPGGVAARTAAGAAQRLSGLVLAAAIAGCATSRPAVVPMKTLSDRSACAARAGTLVVLLPGAHSAPEEFVAEGFVTALRSRAVAADVVIADAHLGYFSDGSAITRLREDVVLPARAAGYRSIWLVGVSLGGFVALVYAARHGGEIDGVFAIAPYPGTPALQREIHDAGGPRAWRSANNGMSVDHPERALWAWLGATQAQRKPPVYLGYARGDRFADGLQVMGSTMPAAQVATVPGGHEWAPWRTLWNGWLDRGLLDLACPAPGRVGS